MPELKSKQDKQSLCFRNLDCLVSCDDSDRVYEHCDLFVENGRISQIGEVKQRADVEIDGRSFIVYPGLINTHHHLYQILTRNLPQVQNLELFDWLTKLYEIWAKLNAEGFFAACRAGMGELIKFGCTTVFDHHYVFPENSGDLLAAEVEAADLMGIRLVLSRGSMDLSQKDGGLPPDSVVQSIKEILEDSEALIDRYHDERPFSMRQVVLAPCSPFSVSEELLRESAKLARSKGVRLHTHLAETRDEEVYTQEHYGIRPLEYMARLGWLGKDVWFAHGVHFNDAELDLLAETGTGVAHCPASNMKLSSGICRVPELLQRGVHVGLAVDGSASNDGSSLLEEMRIAYLLHRLSWGEKAPSGYELLKMATRGGAALLGRPELGQLAVGKAADFFAIQKYRLELAGASFDPENMLATIGIKAPVDFTVVNGKNLYKQGKLLDLNGKVQDENEISRQVERASRRMQDETTGGKLASVLE